MFTAVSGFVLGVWSVIRTYQPTAAEGAAMFFICVLVSQCLAASRRSARGHRPTGHIHLQASCSWLVLACAGIVAVVAVPVAVVSDVARLSGGDGGRPRAIHGARPHD